MAATLHRLFRHCASRGVALRRGGFSLSYHTTIPRQVGLSGSSAIITALARALMAHFGLGGAGCGAALDDDRLATFVLAVESEELGITAGLQDRVVQAYGGAVHMDFDRALLAARGFGAYARVPARALPPLFLAYAADPSDSGRIHAPIKQRWLAGDAAVVDAMAAIAALADAGRDLAAARPYAAAATAAEQEDIAHAWAELFRRNFDARRALFGEARRARARSRAMPAPAPQPPAAPTARPPRPPPYALAGDAALGADNLRMIAISRELGASGKFPGSGGAVVGVVDVGGMAAAGALAGAPPLPAAGDDADAQRRAARARVEAALERLQDAYTAEGFVFTPLTPALPDAAAAP
jgi:glucuronokinase